MNHPLDVRAGRAWPAGLLCAAALAVVPGAALSTGTEFALAGHVIAGGGVSHARNECFGLSGTLGETTAGSAAAAGYAVASGFWAAPVAGPDQMFRSSFEDCQS